MSRLAGSGQQENTSSSINWRPFKKRSRPTYTSPQAPSPAPQKESTARPPAKRLQYTPRYAERDTMFAMPPSQTSHSSRSSPRASTTSRLSRADLIAASSTPGRRPGLLLHLNSSASLERMTKGAVHKRNSRRDSARRLPQMEISSSRFSIRLEVLRTMWRSLLAASLVLTRRKTPVQCSRSSTVREAAATDGASSTGEN